MNERKKIIYESKGNSNVITKNDIREYISKLYHIDTKYIYVHNKRSNNNDYL